MEEIKPTNVGGSNDQPGAPTITKIPVTDVQPRGTKEPDSQPAPPASEAPWASAAPTPAPNRDLNFEENAPDAAPFTPPTPTPPPQEPIDTRPDGDGTVHPHAPLQTTAKKKTPMVVIVVAVLVAAGLAVLLVYVFMKGRQSTTKTTTTTPTTTTQQAAITPKDIDTATTEIDKNITSVDEKKDLSPTDLTDQTLGL